jgi:glucan endo-1,3-alpha-glucosidase
MTSISPCFYTHYAAPGSTPSGAWEWGKNWLYASDDMLMLRRWEQLLELDHCSALAMQEGQGGGDDSTSPAGIGRSPDIVQVISWNDYGESHYICPSVLGCQPGSEAWVDGMPHRAFAEMTRWMAGRWRDGKGEVELLYDDAKRRVARGSENGADVEPRAKVWIWYRIHPAGATATGDERGKPGHVDRAVDLFKIVVLLPHQASTAGQSDSFGESEEHSQYVLVLHNGPTSDTAPHAHEHSVRLRSGGATAFTVPFVPGPVGLGIRQKGIDGENAGRLVWQAEGAEIHAEPRTWNYNFWSYSWDVDLWS